MPVSTPASTDDNPVLLLTAALAALDRAGDTVAAAYVSMALVQVERRPDTATA